MTLGVVTLGTGMSTGFSLFFRLVYVLGITTVLAYVWNWLSLKSLEVEVERRSRRVRVGDEVHERITVRNKSAVPKGTLEVEDLTDLPGYSSAMAVSLASKGFRSWRTNTPARRRGVYTMGPVRVTNTDPFGLFKREKTFGGSETLTVYPRTFDVSGFTIPAAYLSGESAARRRSHNLTPHASSVREYAFGDSISRVHWNSTARMAKLMSKEFDLGMSSDVWLLVDLHKDVQAGELDESTDEYAVSVAASLAQRYIETQMPVGLIAYGEDRYMLPADTGTGQFDRIMEFLAMSKAEGDVPLEDALPREEALWSHHTSLIIITSSHVRDWIRAVDELTKRRVRVAVILLDGASFGGYFNTLDVVPELYVAGVPPYVVAKGDDLPIALDHFYVIRSEGALEQPKGAEVRI